MTESGRDRWAEWLLHRRFGGDADEQRATLDFLEPIRDRVLANAAIAPGETLLDVGCGDGLIAFGALDRVGDAGRVILSDVSQDLLDHARGLAAEMGVTDRCRFVRASADDLAPIADASVDVVTTRSVLIYVAAKQRAFDAVFRVLRPGGRISLFEPINRFGYAEAADRFWGYDVGPLPEIAAKVRAVFHRRQPLDADPMMDFDERDLLAFAERAGVGERHLELRVDVAPHPPRRWETFAATAFNPTIPTLAEAMAEALTPAEAERFAAHLRPLVEAGQGTMPFAVAYLWGTKAENAAAPLVPTRPWRYRIRRLGTLGPTAVVTAEPEEEDAVNDPFLEALDAAPLDDEPFTPEDRAAADAGWNGYLRGESSPLDEVRQRLLDEAGTEAARRTADESVNLPPWRLEIARQAEHDLDRLPPDARRRILDALPGPTTPPLPMTW